MNNLPKISVIVPIYNCEKYLERCLNSLSAQNYPSLEIILVDDGSSDGSAELCKSYAERDSRFIYIYRENGGVSSARNLGIDKASGELLAFVDGDDEILPDMLTSLYEIMTKEGADVSIISLIVRINGKDVPYSDSDEIVVYNAQDAIKEALRGVIFGGHLCNKLFKASLFENVRLREDLAICEDLVAVYEAFLKCNKIAFSDTHKYIYYTNDTSAINATFKESFLSYITATKYLVDRVKAELPEIVDYALCSHINAYIDVLSKLYYAKRLSKDVFLSYRAQVRELATPSALTLMPRYKRIIVGAIKGAKWRYVLTLKAFNFTKKIIYRIKNK